MKTKNKRRKVRQQQKHTNQILGRILGEKNNRKKLTLRHKKRKEYQPSFGNSVAKNFVRIKVKDPSVILLHIIRRGTSLLGNWQGRRKTYSNNRKNFKRNPNFVVKTSK
jgi:hypothetical protein